MSFQDKTVLITGGSSGIGFATAKRFVQEGANVIITGRDGGKLNAAAAELGPKATTIVNDAGDLGQVRELFTTLERQGKRLDTVFLNAGVIRFAPVAEVTLEDYEYIFDINVRGPLFAIQAALPLLNPGASIILNTSIVNQGGMPGSSVYSASKAAVKSIVQVAAAELAPTGVRVNAVSPGPIDTPIFATTGASPDEIEQMAAGLSQQVAVGRFGRAEEVANATLFLASDAASFVVGQELVVDGGFTL